MTQEPKGKIYTITVSVKEFDLRNATDDEDSDIVDLIEQEMGWAQASGIHVEGIEEAK